MKLPCAETWQLPKLCLAAAFPRRLSITKDLPRFTQSATPGAQIKMRCSKLESSC